MRAAWVSVYLFTIAAIGGCASLPVGQSDRDAADAIAHAAGLRGAFESAGPFKLLTYRRGTETAPAAVHVYIEGDGRAWRARRPPRNPTPHEPMGLRLAARDPSAAVLWIGRPCMYLSDDESARCESKWWTSHRYAPPVVDAINAVIDRVVGSRPVVLIGHSGGGALAVLAASRRAKVDALLTVCAPLDVAYWTEQGTMTPLFGSLDPVDVAHLLADLPQRHLAGNADRVVPEEVVRRFVRALPQPNRARFELHDGGTHQCCWERDWPGLLSR